MDAPIPSSSFELPCRVAEMSGARSEEARSESDESERALAGRRKDEAKLHCSKIRQT